MQEQANPIDSIQLNKLKLGVVIVTYNRKRLLAECVKACVEQSAPFDKIIVVNNASTDGTAEYLATLNTVNVIHLKTNIGGAGGFYTGLEYATKKEKLDYILLIDDDAIIDNNFNANILPYMLKDPTRAYSGTVVTNNHIQYIHRRHLVNGSFRQINSTPEDYRKASFDYDLSTFCGLYVPTSLVKKIGLPRKDFFIWFDDTEYSLRIIKRTKIINVNSAKLNHKTKNSDTGEYSWKTYYGTRNQYLILKQYYPFAAYSYVAKIMVKTLIWKFLSLLNRNRKQYYTYAIKLHRDAINDAKHHKTGINNNYTRTYCTKKEAKS